MSNHRLAFLKFDMGWSMWVKAVYMLTHIGQLPDKKLLNPSFVFLVSSIVCLSVEAINYMLFIITNSFNDTVT
jgi:hypothetical protein